MQTMTTGQFVILEVVPDENNQTSEKSPYKISFPSDMRIGTYQRRYERGTDGNIYELSIGTL